MGSSLTKLSNYSENSPTDEDPPTFVPTRRGETRESIRGDDDVAPPPDENDDSMTDVEPQLPAKYTPEFRRLNIGNFMLEETPYLWAFFLPVSDFFAPIRKEDSTKPGSWLANQEEPGQSYDTYASTACPFNRVDAEHDTIYLVTLNEAVGEEIDLPLLQEAVQLYYSSRLNVVVIDSFTDERFAPHLPALLSKVRTRERFYGKQFLIRDLFVLLQVLFLPQLDNVYSCCAITGTDLYPSDDWNFLLGMASCRERIGVFSYCRYYRDTTSSSEPCQRTLQHQLTATCIHEIGHQFSLRHCIDYLCVMNGFNSAWEGDCHPTRFCPCCLRKLKHCIGFDVKERYQKLAKFLAAHTDVFGEELAKWMAERLEYQREVMEHPFSREHCQEFMQSLE